MDNKVIEMIRKVRNFTKKADPSWSGDSGTGILAPDYMGLGFGSPGGGGEGLGNQINLPPSHQGHPGNLAAGPWSGDSNIRERFTNEVVKKEMPADWTPEGLISEIKNLLKINTPESRDKATFLKDVLDDKVRRMKASRRTFDSLNLVKNARLVAELKNDTFVQALFAEHDVALEKLDELESFPEELSHFALHNLAHSLLKTAQTTTTQIKPIETEDDVDDVDDSTAPVSELEEPLDSELEGIKLPTPESEEAAKNIEKIVKDGLATLAEGRVDYTKVLDYVRKYAEQHELSPYLQVVLETLTKLGERVEDLTEQYDSNSSFVDRVLFLEQKSKTLNADLFAIFLHHLEFIGAETGVIDLLALPEPARKVASLTANDFYEFYGASLSTRFLGSPKVPEAWNRWAEKRVIPTIESFAKKLLKIAKHACHGELAHFLESCEGAEYLIPRLRWVEKYSGGPKKLEEKNKNLQFSWDEIIYMFSMPGWQEMYGGASWAAIAQEAKKLESMLPATAENVGQVAFQVDHLIDMEHNSGLFLSDYVGPELAAYRPVQPQTPGYSSGLGAFLTDKTHNWSPDTFKENAPTFYNIYEHLSKYAKKKLTKKQGQTSQQPIKGECPESEKVVYVSISDLVENDFKADCPEGKRHLEHVKPVSIREYVKHKKHKKKATELQPLKFTPGEQEIVKKVRDVAEALDIDIYLVGGFIRDRISSRDKDKEEAGDLDFMCEHDTQKVVQYLVKKHGYKEPVEYSRSKAIMLNMDEHPIDFIDAKRIYRPLETEGYSTLEEEEDETVAFDDAFRRDLTVNALMYDVRKNELLDPTGRGIQDLKEGVLNTIIDPFIKFRVHAPDMLRALRFAATLGFKLGPNMLEAMRTNAERVRPRDQGGDISNRRVRKELRKAIDKPEHWAKMRELLQQAGLDIVLAEDIQDVQEDFEGGIEYKFDDEKSKLLEKPKEEKAMVKRFTKKAADDRVSVGSDYYLLPLSSKTPITGYSLVRKDLEKKQPDKVVGLVSLSPNTNAWTWEPTMSDRSYGKFSSPQLAAEELIKSLASIRGFTKQSGMFDWLVGKKPPTLDIVRREEEAFKKKKEESKKGPTGLGTILPASKAEQVRYLARKIDQQLLNVPAQRHEQFVLNTLTQYKIGKFDPRYTEILSLLQNYRKGTISKDVPPASKEVEWRD